MLRYYISLGFKTSETSCKKDEYANGIIYWRARIYNIYIYIYLHFTIRKVISKLEWLIIPQNDHATLPLLLFVVV